MNFKKVLLIDGFEKRLLIEGMNYCRTKYPADDEPTEDINNMLLKAMKARGRRKADKTVYKMKMKEFDYRVLISGLNYYCRCQKAAGVNVTDTRKFLLDVLEAYGV